MLRQCRWRFGPLCSLIPSHQLDGIAAIARGTRPVCAKLAWSGKLRNETIMAATGAGVRAVSQQATVADGDPAVEADLIMLSDCICAQRKTKMNLIENIPWQNRRKPATMGSRALRPQVDAHNGWGCSLKFFQDGNDGIEDVSSALCKSTKHSRSALRFLAAASADVGSSAHVRQARMPQRASREENRVGDFANIDRPNGVGRENQTNLMNNKRQFTTASLSNKRRAEQGSQRQKSTARLKSRRLAAQRYRQERQPAVGRVALALENVQVLHIIIATTSRKNAENARCDMSAGDDDQGAARRTSPA